MLNGHKNKMNSDRFANDHYQRAANLRQRLLRTSRMINTAIVTGLQQRGFTQLKSTHTVLLSNLDLEGSSLTNIAQRAGMTKQAMGRLSDELIKLNYIKRTRSKSDKREVKITFTRSGLKLMHQSFEIMDDIEKRCAKVLGENDFNKLLTSLQRIESEFDNDLEK